MTLNAKPTPIHGTPSLTLDTIAVRSIDGLFCLNDLHKAAGGDAKKQPAFFLRNEQTKALIEELSPANLQSLKTVVGKGKMQGSYACRELPHPTVQIIYSAHQNLVLQVQLHGRNW